LLFAEAANGKADLYVLSIRDGTTKSYLQTPANEWQARFSPDGDWVAYVSDETGNSEVYVRPFPIPPSGGVKSLISTTGGTQPRWSRDRKTIYYLGGDGQSVMAANVKLTPTFSAGAPRRLFDVPSAQVLPEVVNPFSSWDVAPDGKRFLVTTGAAQDSSKQAPISIVMNWFGLVK